MLGPILLSSSELVVTTTEEASFRERASGSGLRKPAEVISTPLALSMAALRYTQRPSLSSGRYRSGRPWLADWFSLGAAVKGSHGEEPTRKDLFRWAPRAPKKGV